MKRIPSYTTHSNRFKCFMNPDILKHDRATQSRRSLYIFHGIKLGRSTSSRGTEHEVTEGTEPGYLAMEFRQIRRKYSDPLFPYHCTEAFGNPQQSTSSHLAIHHPPWQISCKCLRTSFLPAALPCSITCLYSKKDKTPSAKRNRDECGRCR
ncbi:hypothetical protein VTK56DRAFT_9484 [Thermocarpiscus australiensis]